MSDFWGSLLDVRRGERRLAFLMATNYFLLLLFYYLLKPARDSLFLTELTPDRLPLVYMLTALVAAPVTAAYARAGLRRRQDRLIYLTILFLVVNLIALRWLINIRQDWVFYLFYTWVGVAGGLTTSQFWLLTNDMFDVSQAKRIFPLLGLGGITGAFLGGEITGFLVRNIGVSTEDLLLVSLAVLLLAAGTTYLAWKQRNPVEEAPLRMQALDGETDSGDFRGIIASIMKSRHLSLTVGILSLTVMTASFVDFQFKTVSWQTFTGEAELTTFLGRFYGRMSLISLLLQIVLASRLIRWIGVGGVLLVLPAVLAVGTVGMIAVPGLVAAMFLRGGDMSLKYSLDKTGRELLFMPIPLALKKRTKVFIDMFVDRWARGLAGGLLLLCTAVFGFDIRRIAVVTLLLVLAWLILAVLMRKEYVNSFRKALSRREIDLAGLRVRIDDAASIRVLVNALAGDNRREIIYALDMLQEVESSRLADAVRPLLDHPDAGIRRRALDVLRLNGGPEDRPRLEKGFADDDLGVRSAAVGCAVAFAANTAEADGFLRDMLAASPQRRNAALAFLGLDRSGDDRQALVSEQVALKVLAGSGPTGREGRRVLAGLPFDPAGCSDALWEQLLRDPDPTVVEAALDGLGRRLDTGRIDWLLEQLGSPRFRTHARRALSQLAARDEAVPPRLETFFRNADNPVRARVEIPRVLAAVPVQESVEILQRHLATHQPEMRFDVLKALGKLRTRYAALRFDDAVVSREVMIEAGRYIELARVGVLLPTAGEQARLLGRAITETQQLRLESVFRLLGLLYPAKDLLNAYHGVMSGRRVLKANAQEFLDNLLKGRHRLLVLSLIDEQPAHEAWSQTGGDLGLPDGDPARTAAEALDFLGASCDPWLAACALAAGGTVTNPAASVYLEKTGDAMLSAIEKVLLLQNVEVFSEVPTDQLAALAGIAREMAVLEGDVIFKENDSPDALYLVLEGHVGLHQGDREVTTAGKLKTFGTWALFDHEPRVLTATATEDSRLLRIDRNEFSDLLSDDVRIAQGIIRTVARRLRDLAGKAS
jgi:ATP/ADP translocase/HEAT repeat protein